MRKFTISILLTIFTNACDAPSSPWLAGEPVKLLISTGLPKEVKPDLVRKAVEDRLAQFGMKTSPQGRRTITVNYDLECKCLTCIVPEGATKDMVVAYVGKYDFQTITICGNILKWYPDEGDNLVYSTVSHEMCHVLGFSGHNDSDKGNLCSPSYNDHWNVQKFSTQDIKDICSFGGIKSIFCNQ